MLTVQLNSRAPIGDLIYLITRLGEPQERIGLVPIGGRCSLTTNNLRRLQPLTERLGIWTIFPPNFKAHEAYALAKSCHLGPGDLGYPIDDNRFNDPQLFYQGTRFIPHTRLRNFYLKELATCPRPWIGLSHAGGAPESPPRSIPAESLAHYFHDMPGTLIDLQYHVYVSHVESSEAVYSAFASNDRSLIRFPTYRPVADIDDAAALVSCMDVVVNADNSNAFLAAALCVPTVVLTNKKTTTYWKLSDFQWLTATVIQHQSWDHVIREARMCAEAIVGMRRLPARSFFAQTN